MKKIKPTIDELKKNIELINSQNKILILDLESTCTDNEQEQKTFINEVIEFGMVIWNRPENTFEKIQIYCKPKKSQLNDFCTQLTGIIWNDVRTALVFSDNMKRIEKIIKDNNIKVFVSFGDYDKNQLTRQSKRDNCKNAFESLDHVNVRLNSWLISGLSNPLGMEQMLKHFNFTLEGRHHSGLDDAYNISKLVKMMAEYQPTMTKKPTY